MSARCDVPGNALLENEVEPMGGMRLHGHGSLGLESASILVRDTYRKTAEDVVPFVTGC